MFLLAISLSSAASLWDFAPDVIVCPEFLSNRDSIKFARDYWSEQGFDIGEVSLDSCEETLPGGIYFYKKVSFNSITKLGNARVHYYIKNDFAPEQISHSVITLSRNYTDDKWLYVHEMGHSLGLDHVSDTESIMHPYHISHGGTSYKKDLSGESTN